ncbi:TPR-like protein [Zopfia rhizophila CBS 207.26]|uniref:TPR-like protein n=1 Tax=Zopfia rhizophila CBS 207.26 TaxID=1314779 RepID=A0A6A6E0F2_9PEZI|nr:TPR-like protein [Zopfia rhizophila CBS 207.26]
MASHADGAHDLLDPDIQILRQFVEFFPEGLATVITGYLSSGISLHKLREDSLDAPDLSEGGEDCLVLRTEEIIKAKDSIPVHYYESTVETTQKGLKLAAAERYDWCFLYCQKFLQKDGYAETIDFLEKALMQDPLNGRIGTEVAWYQALDGDYETGLSRLQETDKASMLNFLAFIKANSNFVPAYTSLGIFYEDYKTDPKWRLARSFTNQAEWDIKVMAQRVVDSGKVRPVQGSKTKKGVSWPFSALGVVQMNKQKYQRSIVPFSSALRISPDNYHSHIGLEESYHNSGRYNSAARTFQKAVENWFMKYMFANVNRELSEFDDAIKRYDEVLSERPNKFGVCIETDFFGSAADSADRAIGVTTSSVEYKSGAFKLWKTENFDRSPLAATEKLLWVDLDKRAIINCANDIHVQAVAWYNLGWTETAMKSFKRAVELEAGNSEFWNSLVLYLLQNDLELAHMAFSRAQSTILTTPMPGSGEVIIALLYGDHNEALSHFTHAFELSDSALLLSKCQYSISIFDYLITSPSASSNITHLIQPHFAFHQLNFQQPGELSRNTNYGSATEEAETALDLTSEADSFKPTILDSALRKTCLSARIMTGLAHYCLSNMAASIANFRTAFEESISVPDIIILLAEVLWTTSDNNEKDKHPEHVDAIVLLGAMAAMDEDVETMEAVRDDLSGLRTRAGLDNHQLAGVEYVLAAIAVIAGGEGKRENEVNGSVMAALSKSVGWTQLSEGGEVREFAASMPSRRL